MTGLEDVICGLAQSSAAKREPGDYEKDGLLYCGRRRTPKQCIADFGTPVIVGCTCLCEQEKIRAELAEQKRMERMMEIRALRTQGIQDHAIRRYRFDTAFCPRTEDRCYAGAFLPSGPRTAGSGRYFLTAHGLDGSTGFLHGDKGNGQTLSASAHRIPEIRILLCFFQFVDLDAQELDRIL